MPLLFLLLALVVSSSPQQSQAARDEQVLKQLEREWGKAYVEVDSGALNRILADDFIGRWADGSTTNKRDEIESVRTGREQQQSSELLECEVRMFGDTAVVTWKTREERIFDGKDASGTFWGTDVFVRRGGRWQAVAAQTSKLADTIDRDQPSAERN